MKRYIKCMTDYYDMYIVPNSLENLKEDHPFSSKFMKVSKREYELLMKSWWSEIEYIISKCDGDRIDHDIEQELSDTNEMYLREMYRKKHSPLVV